ncbi:hypothetical protein PCANC_23876 [Puccinia coronata f. sp. avenae]|uniref:Uncharacterized protein n=1 Tax=Puccinia coronata f. sp. avenae TaxID=200324 RepID=A0A2N5S247_9BASI|nr:hypothetical protein PCANC_23876 [Puccinia coronata f. sp. avenae]
MDASFKHIPAQCHWGETTLSAALVYSTQNLSNLYTWSGFLETSRLIRPYGVPRSRYSLKTCTRQKRLKIAGGTLGPDVRVRRSRYSLEAAIRQTRLMIVGGTLGPYDVYHFRGNRPPHASHNLWRDGSSENRLPDSTSQSVG